MIQVGCGARIEVPAIYPVEWVARTHASLREIVEATAEHHGITAHLLMSDRRAVAYSRPRQQAMYLGHLYCTRLSLPAIGRFFKRDHTTVMHAIKRVIYLRRHDACCEKDLEAICRRLQLQWPKS